MNLTTAMQAILAETKRVQHEIDIRTAALAGLTGYAHTRKAVEIAKLTGKGEGLLRAIEVITGERIDPANKASRDMTPEDHKRAGADLARRIRERSQ